jgi:hypothetical protein
MRPDDDLYVGVVTMTLGFLFGKFTNGFNLAATKSKKEETDEHTESSSGEGGN